MVDWSNVRADFPVTNRLVYFQSAGMSPVPQPVLESIISEYRKLSEMGDFHWQEDLVSLQALQVSCAQLMGATSEDVIPVANTSLAMSLLALAFQKQMTPQSHIISMEDEFPSTTLPFEYQNIKMHYLSSTNSRYPIEEILAQTNENTFAVLTSFVQYCTGFRQNIQTLGEELKKRNILFIVNATQGLPFFPIDVEKMHIDVLTASLHKWGLTGHVGSLFYTSPAFRERFPSPIAGWLSVSSNEEDGIHTSKNTPLELHSSAQQYVQGTFNLQSTNALRTALSYIEKIGRENIVERIFTLIDYFLSQVKDLPLQIISPVATKEERSAILALTMDNPKACQEYLRKNNIHVACRGGNIRVSFNIFNNERDVDILVKALEGYFQGEEIVQPLFVPSLIEKKAEVKAEKKIEDEKKKGFWRRFS